MQHLFTFQRLVDVRLVVHISAVDEHTLVIVGGVGGVEIGDVVVRVLELEPVAEGLVAVHDKLFFRVFYGDGVGFVEDGVSGRPPRG